ncbi:putative spermidine/putrescine transport system ATP-binding protein/spermidine/putrescine transport system ATP-binding protein [Rhizobium sp. BK313]|uniref:ABC transporter ATP-binding protein n=1 Tax=Rhizobium sp. BK313 TaxID=2587081 RepID=UPI00105B7BFB|nr:ABC transporter ATP-binding protein [Rhizobium sp. BK313]MBB3459189.1 putative spermidine/putrescine transport system ATP-binding protein/spermidine/putrescine transport system ATP-binding protein [Rhizobium sp. BK313]
MTTENPARDHKTSDVRFVTVEKKFDTAVALHSLDLDIERGTLFALLGPSGCGKTTTLRLIAGFEQPTSGHVYIRGKDVTGIPAYKRNFGMVFQSFALFPHLTVAENVAFGLQMRGVAKDDIRTKVAAVLDLVALGKFAQRYPRQLSGGQQQRVALARAVVFEPDVLLLDEPLSALDKMLREQMQVEIRQLQKRLGMTTVFVTHDQEEALTMSDRVAVMKDGRIQQAGAPREIYDRPQTEFVATFLGASNILQASVRGREGDNTVIDLAGNLLHVPGIEAETGSAVRLALRPEKITLRPDSPMKATVKEVIYRGAQTLLYLDMNGMAINAVLPNSDVQPASVEPGSPVGLHWEKANMVALDRPA